MKSIKRRIAFHFSIQFIFMIFLVTTVLLVVLFFVVKFIVDQEVHKNYPNGMLEAIASETMITESDMEVRDVWIEKLYEKSMWLQIVNKDGEVIYDINIPPHIPDTYSMEEIMKMEDSKVLGDYQISTLVDSMFYDQPYYYVLGYQDEKQQLLLDLIEKYNENGTIKEEDEPSIGQKIKPFQGYLDIINHDGQVIDRIGASSDPKQYDVLQITAQLAEPNKYGSSINVKKLSNTTWVLHSELDGKGASYSIAQQVILVLISIGAVILLLLIFLSVWHGIRYGQPLLLFISWLERMRNGQYEQVFTDKERKKLFNKRNGVKRRYRLYKEVIAEFYDMAEQLASLEKERGLLEQKREEWMAGISHDLRTPLSTIQGYGHLLESSQYQWDDKELQEIGETIRKKSDYMLELIQDFSLISQLKQKELPVAFSELNLVEIIEGCVDKYKEYSNIHLSLPEYPLLVLGNAQWIERLLDNLIINAVKHNSANTTITISATTKVEQIEVKIADNGIGMDEKTQQNLFTRYFRGTRSEDVTDGSGLGMSIAKAIVQAHNGTIYVESEVNNGTTIRVNIPKA
ncbi:sensor histidine kinase [Aquibacillus kalidii]|uniref:sensor histidine kinase n=1 Tax=Aquibacillus kalidii TaxID=2762597 RepID=UPI00164743CB|nr:HAMP domain-containing sensor histidine kinase [Aquibacillus kalidii]